MEGGKQAGTGGAAEPVAAVLQGSGGRTADGAGAVRIGVQAIVRGTESQPAALRGGAQEPCLRVLARGRGQAESGGAAGGVRRRNSRTGTEAVWKRRGALVFLPVYSRMFGLAALLCLMFLFPPANSLFPPSESKHDILRPSQVQCLLPMRVGNRGLSPL